MSQIPFVLLKPFVIRSFLKQDFIVRKFFYPFLIPFYLMTLSKKTYLSSDVFGIDRVWE